MLWLIDPIYPKKSLCNKGKHLTPVSHDAKIWLRRFYYSTKNREIFVRNRYYQYHDLPKNHSFLQRCNWAIEPYVVDCRYLNWREADDRHTETRHAETLITKIDIKIRDVQRLDIRRRTYVRYGEIRLFSESRYKRDATCRERRRDVLQRFDKQKREVSWESTYRVPKVQGKVPKSRISRNQFEYQ